MIKRSLLLMAMLTLSLFAAAQNEYKVAVWETKCSDNSILPMQATMVRGGMETAVGNTAGYKVFDRSAFDVLMKEHGFQRSGAVKDEEIKQMGQLAGVEYIIVPEAMANGSDFYIIVKMLDVESGEFGAVYDALCTSSAADIYKACRELGAKLFGNASPASSVASNSATTPTTHPSITTQQGEDKITINVKNVSFNMIKVEAGSFVMGCSGENDKDCFKYEKPSHNVTITRDYYIGEFEVTQELYEAVMGVNPSKWKGSNHPVEKVSWNDAQEFCAELSHITGRNFTLPTEAEWEYAARGGKKSTNTKYSGSSSVDNVAWYFGNSSGQTHPVGRLRPNELGLYDMNGNVYEWCLDWYGSYSSESQTDPTGPASGVARVMRGNCWGGNEKGCRVSFRLCPRQTRQHLRLPSSDALISNLVPSRRGVPLQRRGVSH